MAADAARKLQDDHQLALEAEIGALTAAARMQEKLVLEGYQKMDTMLQEVEAQRNKLRGTNDELARAQAYLDRVIDTMSEVLLVVGTDGSIVLTNARLSELSGYTREQLIGMDASRVFADEELQALAGGPNCEVPRGIQLLRLLSDRRDGQIDGNLVARDGARLAHLFRWANLYSAKGKKEGVVVVGADVRKLHFTLSALERAQTEMRLVLNNIQQGLLTVGMDGMINAERSARVEAWFGEVAPRTRIWEYLGGHDATFGEEFEAGWEAVVEDFLPVELNMEQLPRQLESGDRTFDVAAAPIFEKGALSGAFIVITDITEALRAAEERKLRSQLLDILGHASRERQGFSDFVDETQSLVDRLVGSGRTSDDRTPEVTVRLVHTIKGNASLFDVKTLEETCHRLEENVRAEGRGLSGSERQELEAAWCEFSGQVATVLGAGADDIQVSRADYQEVVELASKAADPEALSVALRRLALEPTAQRFERIAQQAKTLARRVGKGEIDVTYEACPERFSPELWLPFWSAFAHALRNAIDHGLETPAERRAAGKPAPGRLHLRAAADGDLFKIELSDDGQGIDWDKVKRRAGELGLPHDTDDELQALILRDGFSTRDEVTMLSGRGAGMGALTAASEELGAGVEILTERGKGTTLRFLFPRSTVV